MKPRCSFLISLRPFGRIATQNRSRVGEPRQEIGWSRNPRVALDTVVGHRTGAMLKRRSTRRFWRRCGPNELRAVVADEAADPQVVLQYERQRLILPAVRVDRMVPQKHGDFGTRERPSTLVPGPTSRISIAYDTWPTPTLSLRSQASPVISSTRRLKVKSPIRTSRPTSLRILLGSGCLSLNTRGHTFMVDASAGHRCGSSMRHLGENPYQVSSCL